MPGFYDVYVLARERSAALAEAFLDAFVPKRKQSAEDYIFRSSAGAVEVACVLASEAVRYCAAHHDAGQDLYFRNLGDGPAHGMLFFTPDGGLILGLSVDEGEEIEALDRLKAFAGTSVGYIDFESPPPDTEAEFRRIATIRV